MPHYRAVMATTIDCEGCKFDTPSECISDEGCIAFDHQKIPDHHKETFTPESTEDLIKKLLSIVRKN